MGQQQLLLILLGIIIVGIAIALSISLFRENAIQTKRDLLIQECISIGEMALAYYRMPVNFGGGGKSFTGWEIPDRLLSSENGTFNVTINSGDVIINGVGNEIATGSDSIEVNVTVTPAGFTTEIVH